MSRAPGTCEPFPSETRTPIPDSSLIYELRTPTLRGATIRRPGGDLRAELIDFEELL